jgi:sugar O-acyltransferase (sialic acid O-acetyltransferase NeuD family)
MAKVIIFGIKDLAELAHFYLSKDSEHEVVAFSVHKEYLPEEIKFCGLPVFPFEKIQEHYPSSEYSFFAPMTHYGMNKQRERVYYEIKSKGYKLISYISSKSTVFDKSKIGDNCFLLEDNTIQPFVEIGNNVILWSGNHIGHHSVIKDHVFMTSQVVISGNCVIEPYCFIGVNSALKENITLGEGTFVAMCTSITKDTESYSVYSGNPSKKIDMSSLKIRFS